MKSRVERSQSRVENKLTAVGFFRRGAAAFVFFGVAVFFQISAFAQPAANDLQKTADGAVLKNWLISNQFPAEIDAGMWENFNRFNIEKLPQKDWLAPFGGVEFIKPQIGTAKANHANIQPDPQSEIENPKSPDAPLPEVGAASSAKTFADVSEITWREYQSTGAPLDFYDIFGGKNIGTAYAASRIDSGESVRKFIETDGFTGAIWLNGAQIYDGYRLNRKKVVAAPFVKGANFLIVRASGVAGDYWRKNGGWTATIRIWKNETDARQSAESPAANQTGTIFYLEGFHVDPVYLQDQRGYARITLSNTNQYVNSLRADARYGVFLSEIDYLKPYLDTRPEDREFLRQAVREGRVGTGGAYNQFNELTIGGESIIRNILYGQAMHEAMLGRRARSLALWDVFGHAPQISQIALKSGFNGVAWSKKISGFEPFFYDYALDGSRLLHRRVDYAYSFSGFGSGKNYPVDDFRRMTEKKFEETRSHGSAVDLRINAADFTPPWTNLAGNVEKLESNKPQIRVTGQAQDFYFDRLNEEIATKKVRPPVTSRDKLFFHVGVMAARSDLKIGQRLAENAALTAEKFGAIAYLRGANYPDLAIDKAWRQIFFGSHHDAITGTPSDSAFLDLVHGYREAFELSNDALRDSLRFIAGQVNTNYKLQITNYKLHPVVVFNPSSWQRNDVVRLKIKFENPAVNFRVRDPNGAGIEPRILNLKENEAEIEFVAQNVPSLGYKTFYVEPLENRPVALDKGYPEFLENEFYRIKIDANRGGAVTSIFDKQANREIVNTRNNRYANEIAVLREELTKKNVIYPAWEFWTTGEKSFSSETKATFSFQRNGDWQTCRIQGVLPNRTVYRQTITLRKGVKRIDFKTELVDYTGKDELFVVNFPLNLSGGALVTEDRFGTVARNGSKGFLDFRTNTDKLVSGAPVYAVNNWAEYGSTLDLNFVDAGGKRVASVPFKPTALVRPHGEKYEKLTERIVGGLIKRGVSVTPFYDDNDAARRARLSIEDSTMPKRLNDDRAYHNFRIALGGEKENLYSAQLFKQISARAKSDFEARLARDGFAYLFIYDKDVPQDWSPVPTLLIAGDAERAVENLLAPISRDEFALNVSRESLADAENLPNVPDYGVALINNGTPAVSLENPSTLTLFLTHTAIFPGVNLPFEFVPENKTHVFNYALYPHAGNWRAAETVKVGEDFNNPLIAVQTDVHDGDLPAQNSFLTTGKGVVLSALKLGDNPQADFRGAARERALIARFYEPHGRTVDTSAVLRFHPTNRIYKTDLLEKSDESYADGLNGLEESFMGADGNRVNEGCCSLLPVQLKPFEIQTYKLFAARAASKNDSFEIGAAKEIVQPVFSRYWMHNQGAAPIGNDAVKVSLRPVEQMNELSTFAYDDKYNQGGTTTVAVRVQVVNNLQDRNYKGAVRLAAPEDWRVVPDTVKFDIAPNGSFTKDVVVVAFPVKKNLEFERASGLIKARIEHEGQIFEDVLNLGKPFNLEWTTEKNAAGSVVVKIKNPHRQTIEGAVALIAPPEAWAMRIFSDAPAFPREKAFSVAPASEISLVFETGDAPPEAWAIARIAYNGNVDYKRADAR